MAYCDTIESPSAMIREMLPKRMHTHPHAYFSAPFSAPLARPCGCLCKR